MDWAKEFYSRQDEWSGVYTGLPGEQDHKRAQVIADALGKQTGRILELGAGGGQSACATAQRGYDVTAVEQVARTAQHARTLTSHAAPGTLRVIEDSFYTVEQPETFDIICYWDGFGVGSDDQQRLLLTRIAQWLAPAGTALIDINTPWYWSKASGRQMIRSTFIRQYDFDADGCRMLDHWWQPSNPDKRVTQSLRCYSPQDLRLLLEGTNLTLTHIQPGGAVDYDTNAFTNAAPLEQAMQFCAYLRHSTQ